MLSFLVIGAQKAGTTWLYELCKSNPNIWMPPVKEINFFYEIETSFNTDIESRFTKNSWINVRWRRILLENIKRRNTEKQNDWYYKYLFTPREFTTEAMDSYRQLFDNEDKLISGDITPNYSLMKPKTIRQIHDFFPNLKIILCMRNPVFRDFSSMKMDLASRKGLPFEEIDQEIAIKYIENYQARSRYLKMIDRWKDIYGDNFNILVYDELKEDPKGFAKKVASILNVPFEFNEELYTKRVHTGIKESIPEEYKKRLINQYRYMIRNLIKKYPENSYLRKWLEVDYYK